MISVETDWSAFETEPARWVNVVAAQVGGGAGAEGRPDGVILYLAHAEPPIMLGTLEQNREKFGKLKAISAIPVAKIVMSRERAEEVLRVLATTLSQFDQAAEMGKAQADART